MQKYAILDKILILKKTFRKYEQSPRWNRTRDLLLASPKLLSCDDFKLD